MAESLKEKLQKAFPNLQEDDFGYHATDLYVLNKSGIYEWLMKNYEYPKNLKCFIGSGDWDGKSAIEIPFAGKWKQ